MALESVSTINDLVTTNPTATDPRSEGDDHLRNIKIAVKNAFPGTSGPVFRSQTKSAGYTILATDNMSLFNCTAGLTLAVTAAATLGNGFLVVIHANGGAVVIDPNSSETVNGSATLTVPNGGMGLLICNGTSFVYFSLMGAVNALVSTGGLSLTGTLGTSGQVSVVSDIAIGYSKSLAVTAGANVAAIVSQTVTSNYPNHSAWNSADAGDNIWHYFIEGSGGAVRGSIDYNRAGTLTRYNTTSDMTLKTLIGDATTAKSLEVIMGIRLREFYWNHDISQKPQIAPFAQELYETFPGAVSVGGDEERIIDVLDEEGKKVGEETVIQYRPWGVDKTAPVFHLVAVVQSHENRLVALEARVAELEQLLAVK